MMNFVCDKKYIEIPVNRYTKLKKMEFYSGGKLVYDLDVKLDYINPDQTYLLDVSRFMNQDLKVQITPDMDFKLVLTDTLTCENIDSHQAYRPSNRFSANKGWINDPNGLFYYEGVYHLFYQYNPVGVEWGNMHWGHAVSKDLLSWEEKDIALFPDELGTMFSGSAFVDRMNVSGLKQSDHDVILLFYTAAGGTSLLSKEKLFTQCIAFSTDGGNTFIKYDGNPIIENIDEGNRDPKVVYHNQSGNFVMALYLTENKFALFTSRNLLDWDMQQTILLGDDWECPDFYPLSVDGEMDKIKWVFSGAADRYLIGDFDGTRFEPETQLKKLQYSENSYAAQVWSNTPDSEQRQIRITWNRFEIPQMPFNKSMTFPCEMSIKTFDGEMFLCANPVFEILKLYKEKFKFENLGLNGENNFYKKLESKAYDIKLLAHSENSGVLNISLFGLEIIIDVSKKLVFCSGFEAPFSKDSRVLDVRILVDVHATEIFVENGKAIMCIGYLQDYNLNEFIVKASESTLVLEELEIVELVGCR